MRPLRLKRKARKKAALDAATTTEGGQGEREKGTHGMARYNCKRQGGRAAFDAGPTTENKRMSLGGKGATGWMTPCGVQCILSI